MKDALNAALQTIAKGTKEYKDAVQRIKPGCQLSYDEFNGDYDCLYGSYLSCEECKYGMGRKDPEALVNQP